MNAIQKLERSEKSYVFFDVDDTLISVNSMMSFQEYWYQVNSEPEAEARYRADLRQHVHEQACWNFLNRLYYQYFAGRKESEVFRLGREWFVLTRKRNPNFFNSSVVRELRIHQSEGREVVFVSGSFPALLEPLAEELGVDIILSTRLEVEQGYYTGEILPPQTIGEGKAEAVRSFLEASDISAAQCYAYGDDLSDIPLLSAVGTPIVVAGGRGLEAHARSLGWRIIAPA